MRSAEKILVSVCLLVMVAAAPADAQIVHGAYAVVNATAVTSDSQVECEVSIGEVITGYRTTSTTYIGFGFTYSALYAVPVSSVEDGIAEIPMQFALDNPYPNPFNASTVVPLQLPHSGHVKVDVYNVMGQKVSSLVDGIRQAGQHRLLLNASHLASGTYFVKASQDHQTAIRKIYLVR